MKKKQIVMVTAGILAAVILSSPAAQAAQVSPRVSPSLSSVCISREEAAREDIGQGDGYLTNGKSITEENVTELLRQIEQDWPTGTVWGTQRTPGTHKNEIPGKESARILRGYRVSNVYGCGAYASMVSSLVFGDGENPARRLEDPSQIRPGDLLFQIRPNGSVAHVTVALESPRSNGAIRVTDGNNGGTVQWSGEDNPNWENLNWYAKDGGSRLEVWTRYPAEPSCAGG